MSAIKYRCSNKKHPSYSRYGGAGISCDLTLTEIRSLWDRDNASKMKNPSIDRINSFANYTLNNCRFIESLKNTRRYKLRKDRKIVCQVNPNSGVVVDRFMSASSAYRKTGIHWTDISSAIRGKLKMAGGYIWRLEDYKPEYQKFMEDGK